tara:strand:+ start:2110 stop:2535 length:426 start_codon:yes stop_codon:yes gene_type:complete
LKKFFRYINRWEKQHFSKKLRKSRLFFWLKLLLLWPAVLLGILERAIKKSKVTRKDKPPIVLANIVSGFKNLAFPNEAVESMAKKRASICAECPAAEKTGVYSVVIDNRTTNIQGMKCKDCGCNLSAKVRSEHDYCPRGNW